MERNGSLLKTVHAIEHRSYYDLQLSFETFLDVIHRPIFTVQMLRLYFAMP